MLYLPHGRLSQEGWQLSATRLYSQALGQSKRTKRRGFFLQSRILGPEQEKPLHPECWCHPRWNPRKKESLVEPQNAGEGCWLHGQSYTSKSLSVDALLSGGAMQVQTFPLACGCVQSL